MDPDAVYDELKRALIAAKATPFMEPGIDDVITNLSEKFYALDHWLQIGGYLPREWENAGRPPTDHQKLAKEISDEFPDRVVQPIKKYRDVLRARENRVVGLKEARDAIYQARGWF